MWITNWKHRTVLALVAVGCLAGDVLGGDPPADKRNHVLYVASATASDVRLKQRIAQFMGEGAQPFVLAMGKGTGSPTPTRRLTPESRSDADDRNLAAELRASQLLVLSGGNFMQWYDTVYPRGPVTYLSAALVDVYRSRKPLIAYGGGCAYLSGGVLIDREQLKGPERNPRRKSPWEARLAVSLGPAYLFDSAEWSGGSPLRLLQAMLDTGMDIGVFFVGQVALDYDRVAKHQDVLGPGSLLLFDLRRARRGPSGFRDGRLSRLRDGDGWNSTEKGLRAAEPKQLLDERAELDVQPAEAPDWQAQPSPNAAQLIAWLEAPTAVPETREARDSTWTLGWDSRSRRGAPQAAGARVSWLELPFDCRWPKR